MNVKDFFQDTVGEERSLFFVMFLLIRNIFITGQVWHEKKNVYCRDDKKTRSEFMCKMTNKIGKSAG